jgi:hypothetical protein
MKCPHCLVEFHAKRVLHYLDRDEDGEWGIESYICPNPECRKLILFLISAEFYWEKSDPFTPQIFANNDGENTESIKYRKLVRPISISRSPIPREVPQKYKSDYEEACLVLSISPKASSVLSRRCLQIIIEDIAKINKRTLADEIECIINSGQLPTKLSDCIDAVRNIGNFAAHPSKSITTGEIVDVESGEAEWNLEVIEMLFDFYFVQPEKIRIKKDNLNQKLKDIGKQNMK